MIYWVGSENSFFFNANTKNIHNRYIKKNKQAPLLIADMVEPATIVACPI